MQTNTKSENQIYFQHNILPGAHNEGKRERHSCSYSITYTSMGVLHNASSIAEVMLPQPTKSDNDWDLHHCIRLTLLNSTPVDFFNWTIGQWARNTFSRFALPVIPTSALSLQEYDSIL